MSVCSVRKKGVEQYKSINWYSKRQHHKSQETDSTLNTLLCFVAHFLRLINKVWRCFATKWYHRLELVFRQTAGYERFDDIIKIGLLQRDNGDVCKKVLEYKQLTDLCIEEATCVVSVAHSLGGSSTLQSWDECYRVYNIAGLRRVNPTVWQEKAFAFDWTKASQAGAQQGRLTCISKHYQMGRGRFILAMRLLKI